MTDPILPTPENLLTPAINKLVELRPNALKHINYGEGVYSHIVAMLRSQASAAIQRLGSGVTSNRLRLASSSDLRDLIQSEYGELPLTDKLKGVGSVNCLRTGTNQGVIPKGTKFRRIAQLTPPPILADAIYEVQRDTFVGTGTTSFTLPLVASTVGSTSSQPPFDFTIATNISLQDTLFDASIQPLAFDMAGGSDGFTDAELIRYAQAISTGQYAPNEASLIAGTYAADGVKHIALIDPDISNNWVANIFIADSSWASSSQWTDTVRQRLFDDGWVGFGCQVGVTGVSNKSIAVSAAVTLVSSTSLIQAASITDNIQAAVQSYFDDRPDWYIWKTAALKAAIISADSRILGCTSITVLDQDGSPIAEPTTGNIPFHYMLTGSVNITYSGPSS